MKSFLVLNINAYITSIENQTSHVRISHDESRDVAFDPRPESTPRDFLDIRAAVYYVGKEQSGIYEAVSEALHQPTSKPPQCTISRRVRVRSILNRTYPLPRGYQMKRSSVLQVDITFCRAIIMRHKRSSSCLDIRDSDPTTISRLALMCLSKTLEGYWVTRDS